MSKNKKTLTIADSYQKYLRETPEENQVDKASYIALCYAYNRLMMDKILNGHKVVLPAKLGTVEVKGFKEKFNFENGVIRGLSPNWRQTKELWENNPEAKAEGKVIYNTNEHSSGVRYKFLWSKKNCHVRNNTSYGLTIARGAKRELSKLIFNGQEYHSK